MKSDVEILERIEDLKEHLDYLRNDITRETSKEKKEKLEQVVKGHENSLSSLCWAIDRVDIWQRYWDTHIAAVLK
jgi:hypothetical protein